MQQKLRKAGGQTFRLHCIEHYLKEGDLYSTQKDHNSNMVNDVSLFEKKSKV